MHVSALVTHVLFSAVEDRDGVWQFRKLFAIPSADGG